MEVRYCEKLDSGDVWVSPVMMCRDEREARNEMHAGWMPGHARWVETRTGGFLFGRDAAGVAMFAPADAENPEEISAAIPRSALRFY